MAAKAEPAGDMPAWNSSGVRCGLGSTWWALTDLKKRPECSTLWTLVGSVKVDVVVSLITASSAQEPSHNLVQGFVRKIPDTHPHT